MRVVFLSPHFPLEMPEFTRGLAEVGAEVYGLGSTPVEAISAETRRYLSGYIQVPNVQDPISTLQHAKAQLLKIKPDRIEALWEVAVITAAHLRAALGVPGQSPEDALAFRDKALMKERLERAGLRVPRNARVRNAKEARAAAERIGFPLIIKPIDGAGTRDTFRCDDAQEFEQALAKVTHLPEASVEEYIDGQEFTYDTVSIDGKPVFDSVAQYHPRPLESRTQEWISPGQMVLRDPHAAGIDDAITFGRAVLRAMNMGTGFTHMEWFRKPNGEIVFGEIAARAPGGRLVDQMNYANDFNIYREWARVVCWRKFEAVAQRRYHVACVFKRALGQGKIKRVLGLDEVRKRLGPWLVVEDLLPIGAQRRDWKQTLISDGCLIARHPDYGTAMEMMRTLVSEVRLVAG